MPLRWQHLGSEESWRRNAPATRWSLLLYAATPPLLDGDDHGVGASEMLHSSIPESRIVHPSNGISAGVVEPDVSLDHHLQAHHEAKGVFGDHRR